MKFTSTIIAKGSGSVGGLTYSRNRYGMYIKAKPNPINPNTPLQQGARNRFQSLAELWTSVLTIAQRVAWNLYASQIVFKDPLGEDIYLTGFNHFIRSNTVTLAAGYPRVDDGPTIFTLAPSDPAFAIAISEATQLISVTFDDTLAWADLDDAGMSIAMSKPVSAGVTFIPPTYRVAGFIDGDLASPPTSPQTVACPFVTVEDQTVLVQARIVLPDGRLSAPFWSTAIIAA